VVDFIKTSETTIISNITSRAATSPAGLECKSRLVSDFAGLGLESSNCSSWTQALNARLVEALITSLALAAIAFRGLIAQQHQLVVVCQLFVSTILLLYTVYTQDCILCIAYFC